MPRITSELETLKACVAEELEAVWQECMDSYPAEMRDEEGIDVRLCVLPADSFGQNGFEIHTGDASFDTDHRGTWGASVLSADCGDLAAMADDLVEQAADAYCQ